MARIDVGAQAHERDPQRLPVLLAGGGLLLLNIGLMMAVLKFPDIGLEHGLMENLQAVGLLLAGGLFVAPGGYNSRRLQHVLAWPLALFCLTFLLLEYDTRPFAIAWLTWLTNGLVRDLCLAVAWLAVAVMAVTRWHRLWRAFAGWLISPSGWCMVVAGPFWLLSQGAEEVALTSLGQGYFLEELLEVNAVALMLASALLSRRSQRP